MLKIRLKRTGRKNLPSYQIVLMDAKTKRDGKILKVLGSYSPISKEKNINLKLINFYLSTGAQPTKRVYTILNGLK